MRVDFLFAAAGLAVGLVLCLVFFGFAIGVFNSGLHPRTSYDAARAHYHHMVITQSVRQVGTEFYNETWRYFLKVVESVVRRASASRAVSASFDLLDGSIMNPNSEVVFHQENSVRTIVVHLTPRDPALADRKPLTLSAHYDGHNVGQSAYDNAINVAMILELAMAIASADAPPPCPVRVVLDGSEEFGLSGARMYVQRTRNWSHVLNLDSLGTGAPFVLSQKTRDGSSVVRSLARVPGVFALTV
jgi:hypothetical protein